MPTLQELLDHQDHMARALVAVIAEDPEWLYDRLGSTPHDTLLRGLVEDAIEAMQAVDEAGR